MDSATMAAMAIEQGFDLYAITFDYGQRHRLELDSARSVAKQLGVKEHRCITLDLRQFGGSSLTSDDSVPVGRTPDQMNDGIPSTYVPARNTIFLSFAVAWAELLGAEDIYIGVNSLDHAGYPDCRPEYIEAYEKMARLATKSGVEGNDLHLRTPLIRMTKTQIVARGLELGIDFALTNTCYDPAPSGDACGTCDACVLRQQAFVDNAMQDPRPYASV